MIKTRLNKLEAKVERLEKRPAKKDAIEYPPWVMRGSGFFGKDRGMIYGVASASGIKNHSLARMTADNRARNEVAKVLEGFTSTLVKSVAPGQAGGFEVAIKTISGTTLNGVEIVDHWIHPDGTIYTLARVSFENWLRTLEGQGALKEEMRVELRQKAKKELSGIAKD